jgi:hypothetical protein
MRKFKNGDYMALGSIPDGSSVPFLIPGEGLGQQLIADGGTELFWIPGEGSGLQLILGRRIRTTAGTGRRIRTALDT